MEIKYVDRYIDTILGKVPEMKVILFNKLTDNEGFWPCLIFEHRQICQLLLQPYANRWWLLSGMLSELN